MNYGQRNFAFFLRISQSNSATHLFDIGHLNIANSDIENSVIWIFGKWQFGRLKSNIGKATKVKHVDVVVAGKNSRVRPVTAWIL